MNRIFNPATWAFSLISAFCLVSTPAIAQSAEDEFSRYEAFDADSRTRIDYTAFDDILRGIVFEVGRSDRIPGRGRDVMMTGTRLSYENTSRYRYEGNRLVLHLLEEEHRTAISQYREELERLPSSIDLASLSSNEQLAYWLNLHNVVVIDELAQRFPIRSLRRWEIDGVAYADADIINIDGHQISLNDIRFNIVGANWPDHRVMYGFFAGAVGGPTIQGKAYTGPRVWSELEAGAREYVNALRGVESARFGFRVSPLYGEWQDVMFPAWPEDLRSHLELYAEAGASATLAAGVEPNFLRYDWSIADLNNGVARCRGHNPANNMTNACTTLAPHTQNFINVIIERRIEFLRSGELGSVTIRDIETDDEAQPTERWIDTNGDALAEELSR